MDEYGEVEVENGLENSEADSGKGRRPQFTVKQVGSEGYAGSAWLSKSKYGDRCISIAINTDIPKGARLYVNPTKACAGIIG